MTEVKPMRADARRNYERLLEEAQRAFAEHGVEASLEDIARRAGVGIGTLYRHFPTRDALLETLLRARFDGQAERARELLTDPAPLDALQAWLLGLGDTTGTFRGLAELTADALNDETSRLYASCHAMRDAASQLVERAKAAGELRADVTTHELLLLLHAASWAGPHLPGEAGMQRLLALVFEGLRAR
ncbi:MULTISPECIES: TetR/AcrR family transcriptional regulator [unclassified Amycolatopsis]|uniref:TetR/AcrR family transcriptional regulator n=1 Tax=unclassified Amycolatopsis TaxID=2618356 RepID=UPI002E13A2A5|nr:MULTISPECIES: helix-turn-helix domain-containing protein [unclassified Amycolatopsis]WSJ76943.1 TetR/AcrR family transcriptional regulator [Amycolatopsis sp. NBC_01307]WSK79482.1 TetR/AcrR family transcriptional regulator [Amycolatopsis sp. NBC_01286]